MLIEKATKESLLPVIFATVFILHLFISNSLGQNMTDYNKYIFSVSLTKDNEKKFHFTNFLQLKQIFNVISII